MYALCLCYVCAMYVLCVLPDLYVFSTNAILLTGECYVRKLMQSFYLDSCEHRRFAILFAILSYP